MISEATSKKYLVAGSSTDPQCGCWVALSQGSTQLFSLHGDEASCWECVIFLNDIYPGIKVEGWGRFLLRYPMHAGDSALSNPWLRCVRLVAIWGRASYNRGVAMTELDTVNKSDCVCVPIIRFSQKKAMCAI